MSVDCNKCRVFHNRDHVEGWMEERNKKIVLLRRAGLSFRSIATRAEIALSHQQIHYVYHQWKNRVPLQESASLQVEELPAPVG